jgi:hypothetical protein
MQLQPPTELWKVEAINSLLRASGTCGTAQELLAAHNDPAARQVNELRESLFDLAKQLGPVLP